MLAMIALKDLCKKRRALSDRLPRVTMRHEARVHAIQDLDAQILAICSAVGITEADAYRLMIGGTVPSSL